MPRTPHTTLRLPVDLRRRASDYAREHGITLSQLVRFLLIRVVTGNIELNIDTLHHRELIAQLEEELEILGASLAHHEINREKYEYH